MASLLGAGGGVGREYVLKIVADVKDAVKGVDDVATKTSSMKDKMLGIGKSVAAGMATAAVAKFGMDSINAAADADDAMDSVVSAFGNASNVITDFSKKTAESMGLSAQDYQAMAAETGRILTGFGISNKDAADSTNTLATRAADMAAIVGGSSGDAMTAINKAMQGQTKGLKAYGISLDNAEVEARAMADGYVDASGKVTDAGKAIATQQLILEKTSKYQGEFAKNSGDLGSQQEILAAKMENLKTTIGTALIPVVLKLFDAIKPLIDFVTANIGWLAPLAGGIMAVVAAVKIWNIAQLILNSTLLANPIFLVIAAVAALTAGIIWAYNNVGWFRDAVDAMAKAAVAAFEWVLDIVKGVWNWIKDNWPLLLGILTGPFGLAIAIVVKNWDSIKQVVSSAIEGIRWLMGQVWDILTWPFIHAYDSIKYVWAQVTNIFSGFVDGLRWLFGQVYDIITYPFRRAMDAIKWLWNSTIGGFGFTLPNWMPFGWGGREFRIPEMASGGIVTRPTLALIGEAGPEAVIPLSRMATAGTTTYVVNVYALNANAETGRMISESLREYNRTTGHQSGGYS